MDEKGATFLCDLLKQSGAAEHPDAGAAEPPRRYLIVLRGGLPGSMIPLGAGLQTVGRADGNTIALAEMSVSRRHALIESKPDGQVYLTDLGSSNGTFHNGRPLPPHQPVPLADGDRLAFGPTVLVKFACPDATEERCQRELFERAMRDALTGLYNRGYFLDQAPMLERQAFSRGLGLAVLLMDVDHFKQVNDTHGHDAGDLVLQEVAAVIRQSTRADDLVARYGGEEFVAALPIASPDQALARAERIRRGLSARRIALGGQAVRVTASLGLAFAPPGRSRPITSLISNADDGLYQAKRAGRDRVVFRGDPLDEPPGTQTTIDYMTV
jgi:diguanylate cyclase (GGDEF)-like protein